MMEIEALDMDLESLLLECASIFSLTAEQKHLEFLAYIEPETPVCIRADQIRLRQILLNLLSNAFKFTHHGHIGLRVYTQSRNGQNRLCLEVSDSGIGMTDTQKGRLFQAFSQADASTTRQFGGTGLGLSICRHLVSLMHGDISVHSQPGQGSVFTVTIPCEPASR